MFGIAFSLVLLSQEPTNQGLDRRVSYEGLIAPLKVILADLTRQSGMLIRPGSNNLEEPLLMSVNEVPLRDVLAKIAAVTGCEWEVGTGVYTLSRTKKLEREQEQLYLADRAKSLATAISKITEDFNKTPTLDAALITAQEQKSKAAREALEAQLRGNSGGPIAITSSSAGGTSPAKRALDKILADLNVNALASLADGTRTVFATSPTKAQRPASDSAKRIANQFVEEYNLWLKIAGKPAEATGSGIVSLRIGNDSPPPESEPKAQPLRGVSKSLIIVTRFPGSPNLNLEYRVFDLDGKLVGNATTTLRATVESQDIPPPGTDTKLALDDESKAFAKSLASDSGGAFRAQSLGTGDRITAVRVVSGSSLTASPGGEAIAPPSELRLKVIDVANNDPLGWVAGPLLQEVAKLNKLNVIASLPDSCLLPLCRKVVAEGFTENQLLTFATKTLGLTISKEGGWLTVAPKFLWLARDQRFSRPSLAKLFQSIVANSTMMLDPVAAYTLSRQLPLSGPGLDDLLLGIVDRDAQNEYRFEALSNWRMLRFYGTMSPAQKLGLTNQGSLALRGLSAAQFDLLNTMIYHDVVGPQIQASQEHNIAPGFFAPSNEQTLSAERTEALPLGAMRQGDLNLNGKSLDGVLASSKNPPRARFFTPEDYGLHLAFSQNPGSLPVGPSGTFDLFRSARSINLQFDFQVAPGVSLYRYLSDVTVDSNSKGVPYEQTSAEFKSRVKSTMDNARNGSVRPPPPRN